MHDKAAQFEDPRRWLASFEGEFHRDGEHTRMGRTQHYGPLRVQRPFHPEGPECLHLYLLHPPGGLVGGDRLSIRLGLEPDAHVLLTTPSAGKIYRNITELSQGQDVSLNVADGATLEYLPQENIVFDGAKGELDTRVDLRGSGRFIGWEITCLGRYENDEAFASGELRQSLLISRDGRPLFSDRLHLQAPSRLQQCEAGFKAAWVYGCFVITAEVMGRDATFDDHLIAYQRTCAESGVELAMTQKDSVWIARARSDKAERLREAFENLWARIRPTILSRPASPPRIWRT